MVVTKLYTAEDLLAMGDDAPYELIRGELREVSPTSSWHSNVGMRIATRMGAHDLDERYGGSRRRRRIYDRA